VPVGLGQVRGAVSLWILRGWSMFSMASRSRAGLAGSVSRRKVPAGPVKVPMWMRSSSRRTFGQVRLVWFSALPVESLTSGIQLT
jgi:hypothetical protein